MEAKHPITGAPIRILRTGANIWKQHKCLQWIKKYTAPTPYDTITVNSIDVDVKYYIFTDITATTTSTTQLQKFIEKNEFKLFLLSKHVITQLALSTAPKNCMILEELYLIYPSLQEIWNGSEAHAVYQIAQVLRYNVLSGFKKAEQIPHKHITYSDEAPQKIWLIQQYYEPKDARRAREIRHCLQKNLDNKWIDKIVLLNENTCKLPPNTTTANKIQQRVIGRRLHYSDVLKEILENVPNDIIVVFANSDIYLDDTISKLWSTDLTDKFLALLRYDDEANAAPKLFGPRSDSQDTWIVAANSVKSREWGDFNEFEIPFGKSGCDNAIAYEMMRKKFLLANPALSIQTIHYHRSNIRNYEPKDIVERPFFVYIDPTPIQEFRAETDLTQYKVGQLFSEQGGTLTTNTNPIFQNVENLKKYFGGQGRAQGQTKSEKQNIFKIENVNLTNMGLVYGYNTLYMGASEQMKQLWSESKVGSLTPSADCPVAIGIPMEQGIHTRPEEYILFYLSRVLAIRDAVATTNTAKAAFWGPKESKYLEMFSWPEKIPLLPRDDIQQASCKEVYMVTQNSKALSLTDVATLRKHFIFSEDESEMKAVIVSDEVLKPIQEELSTVLEKRGYDVWILDSATVDISYVHKYFRGTQLIIAHTEKKTVYKQLGLSWIMPAGGKVIEVQSEDPTITASEISATCGHSHIIIPVGEKKLAEKILAATVDKPILRLPFGHEGLHSHAGDSFRELAAAWASEGYVHLQPTDEPFCSIDNVILYDRPTYKWFDAQPSGNPMLVGNPKPRLGTQRVAPWIFWGRHPVALEAASKKILKRNVANRCVFIGNVENSTQKANRPESWKAACDVWRLNAAQLSQEKYLDAMGTSKFALALAGYGGKCHREVEAMAMGTPLVVTPGVDVASYLMPLKEGVHYIYAETPEEAIQKMETISDDVWKTMSEACKQWWLNTASIEGSFRTTMVAVGHLRN